MDYEYEHFQKFFTNQENFYEYNLTLIKNFKSKYFKSKNFIRF
jgi:hypothetical protein